VGFAAPSVLILITVLVVTAAVLRRAPRAVPAATTERLKTAARTTLRWRIAGLLLGIGVGTVTAQQGALGRGLLLAVPLCALCVLAAVVVGELRVSAPEGPVRSAGLEVRRVRNYLPRGLTRVVGSVTALLVLVLSATTATGSADDLGRAGRWLARRCSAVSGGATGPWPGSFYSLPLGIVVLTGLLLAGFALHRVVMRPRQGEDDAVDDGLRRQAAEAVTAAFGLLVSVPLAGVGLVSASALGNHSCPPAGSGVVVVALVALVPAAVAVAAWCTGLLLASPRTGRPAPTRASASL
jgi:hypothetical protein